MKKILSFLTMSVLATSALAGNVNVEMWTKSADGGKNVFTPAFVKINTGDTVTFISKQKGHNSASLKKTLPKGAKKWKSKIGKDLKVTFKKEGLYG